MNFLKFIKHIFFFLLTLLLGTQTIYSKTELVLTQNEVSFSIEQTQNFNSLEKQLQPNIGFLKEKSKFDESESISAQNQHKFSEQSLRYLAQAGGDISTALRTKIINALPTNRADDLIAELSSNSALKTAMEADEISPLAWKRIDDGGIADFKTKSGYLETLKKITKYENGLLLLSSFYTSVSER